MQKAGFALFIIIKKHKPINSKAAKNINSAE